jgi:hypothetical protein
MPFVMLQPPTGLKFCEKILKRPSHNFKETRLLAEKHFAD